MELDKFPTASENEGNITNRDVREYLNNNFENIQNYLNSCATVEIIERSSAFGELTGDFAGTVLEAINSDETGTLYYANEDTNNTSKLTIDTRYTLSGIGGYARSIVLNLPWRKTTLTASSPSAYYVDALIKITIVLYNDSNEEIGTLYSSLDLCSGETSKKIIISEDILQRLQKNKINLGIQLTYTRPNTDNGYGYKAIEKTGNWTVSIPKTSYLIAVE